MPVAPGLLFHAKPSSSQALSFGAELHVSFAFSYSLNIARASLYGQLDLPSLVIAVIAAVLYRFFFFFLSFSLLAFSAACWMSAALLLQLLSVQPTCSLPCPSALLLLLINYSSANLSVCSASTPAPLWVRSSLSFLYSLPLSPKIPHFLTS